VYVSETGTIRTYTALGIGERATGDEGNVRIIVFAVCDDLVRWSKHRRGASWSLMCHVTRRDLSRSPVTLMHLPVSLELRILLNFVFQMRHPVFIYVFQSEGDFSILHFVKNLYIHWQSM
jgi:hypothetical protein